MRFLRNLGFVSLVLLAVLGVVVDIGYLFYVLFDKTTTQDIFNINDQTPVDLKDVKDEMNLSDAEIKKLEDRKLFEVNLYSNVETKKNNEKTGVLLQELKLQHFTSPDLDTNSIISTGMQYVSDYNGRQGMYTSQGAYYVKQGSAALQLLSGKVDSFGKTLNILYESSGQKEFATEADANNYVSPDFNYYECIGVDGVTWDAKGLQTQLNRKTEFIVKIDGEAYKIRLDGFKDNRWDNRPNVKENGWDIFKYLIPTTWNDYGGKVDYYNWDMVFEDIMHAVVTNNLYTGTHYGVVNLSKYFTVTQRYNEKDKKWYPASEADQQVAYAVVKFNYNTKGAISNKQSIFGVIADDPRFDLTEVKYETDYGQHNVIMELTTASLDKRYSETYNGYLLSMSIDMQRRLKDMPPYSINLTIDLSDNDFDGILVGFDINAFANFEIEKIKIISRFAFNFDFYLLSNCLLNTGITGIETIGSINIVNLGSGVNL